MRYRTRPAGHARFQLWSIVLAAGPSSRLGRAKQLIRVRRQSLLTRTVETVSRQTPGRVIVVLGADALRIRSHLRRRFQGTAIVHNRRWREGMGRSLSAGVAALPPAAGAALVLLVDQPRIDDQALGRLIGAWRRRPGIITAARYDGRLGAPAIFPRASFRALATLEGDAGARSILRGRDEVAAVDLPEAAYDVDTQADLEAL
jgi:molybdenum cofactor cytidylyltransferase